MIKKYLKYFIFVPNILILVLMISLSRNSRHAADDFGMMFPFYVSFLVGSINIILCIVYAVISIVKKKWDLVWMSCGLIILTIYYFFRF